MLFQGKMQADFGRSSNEGGSRGVSSQNSISDTAQLLANQEFIRCARGRYGVEELSALQGNARRAPPQTSAADGLAVQSAQSQPNPRGIHSVPSLLLRAALEN